MGIDQAAKVARLAERDSEKAHRALPEERAVAALAASGSFDLKRRGSLPDKAFGAAEAVR
jgi:hypothetical protein